MTLLGVSTSALEDPSDLARLLAFEPDVVEFYNYPSSALPQVEEFCRTTGIRPALHTPVPYDGPVPLRRFAPTGPRPGDVDHALRLVTDTVRYAARIDALHVVVHFPSPYPPFTTEGFTHSCDVFLDRLAALSTRYGVRVLIENLSPHPLLRTPAQYRDVLSGHPQLGMCLDVGHAHLLGPPHSPLEFARHLGAAVHSMHVYNTTAARYPVHGHELAGPGQRARDGYLDLPHLIPDLLAAAAPAVLVLEHGSRWDAAAASDTTTWLRGLLDRHERHSTNSLTSTSALEQDPRRKGRHPWQ
ncbi:sugar phosphate isomerase/epimerase family protein [Streptomyces eurythermus]